MTFQFDTSGVVYVLVPGCVTERPRVWPDLSPFVQGYVEALFAGWKNEGKTFEAFKTRGYRPLGFRDLAPETLARITEDCELFGSDGFNEAAYGRAFWADRHLGGFPWSTDFPPQTPYLGDDGKVYLREGA